MASEELINCLDVIDLNLSATYRCVAWFGLFCWHGGASAKTIVRGGGDWGVGALKMLWAWDLIVLEHC